METNNMEVVKPYTFKELDATHLFVVLRFIRAIGVENIKKLLSKEVVASGLLTGKAQLTDELYAMVGLIAFDAVALVIDRMADCEQEVYAMLEATSNLTVQEIKALGMVTFTEMLFDFIKRKEFVGFLQVVLKSYK